MKNNLQILALLFAVSSLCIGCNKIYEQSVDSTDSQSNSYDSQESSIEVFDFNFDYTEYDLNKLLPFIWTNTYNSRLAFFWKDYGQANVKPEIPTVGFSYNGYDIYINYEQFRSGYKSITNYKVVPKTYLTIDKATDLGFFGNKVSCKYIMFYYVYNVGDERVNSTESFWKSASNYDLTLDFFASIGMWDSTMFMFDQVAGFDTYPSGVYLKSICCFPIYANDLSEVVAVTFFDQEGTAYTYMKSDHYDEFITVQEYVEHFVDAREKKTTFGRARFYFNKSDYIAGNYSLIDAYKCGRKEFRGKMNKYYNENYK